MGIKYPVLTDNDYKTWKAYGVEAWPQFSCSTSKAAFGGSTSAKGVIEETEGVIKTLLAE